MKLALACDSILKRSFQTHILDTFCDMFPEAEVVTFIHHPGKVLGSLEMRKISSSYLSRFVSDEERAARWSFLFPSVASTLAIPPGIDAVLSFSSGFAHGIKVPPQVKHISYLWDLDLGEKGKGSISQFIFSSYLKHWQKKALQNPDYVVLSSSALLEKEGVKDHLHKKPFEVVQPFIKTKEFPLWNLVNPQGDFPHYLIQCEGLSSEEAMVLAGLLKTLKLKAIGLGEATHLKKADLEKESGGFWELWGERCAGDVSLLLTQAKATFDFSRETFPYLGLQSLLAGRPVVARENILNREVLKEEGLSFFNFNDEENLEKNLKEAFCKMENEHTWFEGEKLRKTGLFYNEIRFRLSFKRILENLLGTDRAS